MNAIQYAIEGFTYYSLSQCTHQQLLSRSKYPVNIYHHTETNQIFVVKQVPYQQKLVKLYRILKDSQTLNIVTVCGLSRLCLTKQREDKRLSKELTIEQEQIMNSNERKRGNMYMLIWMQKCEKSLVDYVQERRKKLSPFTADEIKSFMFQMLTTLRILQKKGICHRDIKPHNILVHRNRYFLCDFDNAMITKWKNIDKAPQQIMSELEYTTVLYSTPKFLKALKQNNLKDKYFDPYKMDVYSFGLTLLYVCSLGKFCIDDRHLYLYNQTDTHDQFIQQERIKYVKRDQQLGIFNNILKLMLDEDQYKRDDFQTLNQKIIEILGINNQSEQSFSTKSTRIRRQDRQKIRKSHGKGFKCGQLKTSQKFILSVFLFTVLIYCFFLIF